nr:hypothetical protein CFP56_56256 [Quercus suber]
MQTPSHLPLIPSSPSKLTQPAQSVMQFIGKGNWVADYFKKQQRILEGCLASMSGPGNPQLYKPHDMFTAIGHCWVLEDEFSYPINPNLRNSVYVHNSMRQEWAWLFREQQMFYDELVGFKLPVPP